MKYAGLEEVEIYIMQWKKTLAQYITMRNILDMCMETERQAGDWIFKSWWYIVGIDLVGVREAYTRADMEESVTEDGGYPHD